MDQQPLKACRIWEMCMQHSRFDFTFCFPVERAAGDRVLHIPSFSDRGSLDQPLIRSSRKNCHRLERVVGRAPKAGIAIPPSTTLITIMQRYSANLPTGVHARAVQPTR